MALNPTHLLWLDMEMTGLSPDTDRIIELAIVVTDADLNTVAEGPVLVVHQPDEVMNAMDNWNKGTHGKSGLIWSGYWAARLAVTERERLRGTIVHGGPIHGYFQPDWLGPSLDTLEYLYDYLPAKGALFGVTGREALLAHAPSLSLDALGILDRPSAPMLVVNGAQDSQIPIADAWRLLDGPGTRDAWINPDGHHMGRSPEWPAKRIFEEVLLPWMRERLDA